MWGLEFAMNFGVPDNKIELIRGRSRWAFPFLSRELAEAHFEKWFDTLRRWKGEPEARFTIGKRWKGDVRGIVMKLFPRPIEMRFPIDPTAFHALYLTFWRPEMWPGEQPGDRMGFLAALDHQDVQMNLWALFRKYCKKHGGLHSSRTAIALSDTAAVEPDLYYYRKDRADCMIDGNYFCGVPDLIAEVLSPASRAIDRGPRQELYRRTGVPHFWLLDPVSETVEVYQLENKSYLLVETYRPGQEFEPELFPGENITVSRLFETQSKRSEERSQSSEPPPPIPEWIIPPETRLGLEYFFLLGHPEHRWEFWANRAPSVLAFGSAVEAKRRLADFLEEACRWEGLPPVTPTALDGDTEQAEIGPFKFTRSERRVHLDVTVDGRKYRDLLKVCGRREAWDWGEK